MSVAPVTIPYRFITAEVNSHGRISSSSQFHLHLFSLLTSFEPNILSAGIMTDGDSKNSSIPAWQQAQNTPSNPSTSTPPSQTSDNDTTATETPSRPALLEAAAKFLHDDSVRDESPGRKVEFLESKGLRKDEIEGLLGVSRNDEATGSSNTSTSESDSASAATKSSEQDENKPESSETSLQTSQPPTVSPSSPLPSSSTTTASTTPLRDVPPVITYPEFLVKQPKPPPLVSFSNVLYTLYGAAGLGASIYGASEYLVKPMLANLTTARHDFSQNTGENLRKLNEKLEQNVSTVPPQLTSQPNTDTGAGDDEDAESVTSDPTELFHRDIATQTSPQDLKPPSSQETDEKPSPTTTVTSHLKRLESINTHLRDFASAETDSAAADDTMRTSLKDLHYYLDGLIYSNPSYGPVSSYSAWNSPGVSDSSSGKATGADKSEEDAMSSFRSEIRGVKGALLSARNFPSSRGGRVGGVGGR